MGVFAGYANTTAYDNVAIGFNSGAATTTGASNISIGSYSLDGNTTGADNIAIGVAALGANTTASYNVAVGRDALSNNTTSSYNTAVGHQAGASVSTGGVNTAIGYRALYNSTTQQYNTAVGVEALYSQNAGTGYNTAMGYTAGYNNTSGIQNVFVGRGAGYGNTTGSINTFVADDAGRSNTSGGYNTYIGQSAGYYCTTGSNNTFLGRYAGNSSGVDLRTSSRNIILSDGTGMPKAWWQDDGSSSRFFLGNVGYGFPEGSTWSGQSSREGLYSWHNVSQAANFYVAIQGHSNANLFLSKRSGYSNSSFTQHYVAGTAVGSISTNGSSTSYNTTSDYRLKENVVDLTNATDRLKQLEPKRFNFIADADTTVDGFLAHEVQTIVPEAVTGTKDGMTTDNDGNSVPDYQGIDQCKLVPLLTAALQEAITKIEQLEARVATLEG